jgi:hypothetical protein
MTKEQQMNKIINLITMTKGMYTSALKAIHELDEPWAKEVILLDMGTFTGALSTAKYRAERFKEKMMGESYD